MSKRKKVIITSNKKIYDSFNMLALYPEITINDIKPIQINKIIKNINKDNKILDVEKIDNKYIIKKVNPLNFKIYLR